MGHNDGAAALALFTSLKRGRTDIPLHLYLAAVTRCKNKLFSSDLKRAVARALFLFTNKGELPILHLVSNVDFSGYSPSNVSANILELKELLEKIDEQFYPEQAEKLLRSLRTEDIDTLDDLMDVSSECLRGYLIQSFMTKGVSESIRVYLISTAMYRRLGEEFMFSGSCDVKELYNLRDKLSEEELFNVLFYVCPVKYHDLKEEDFKKFGDTKEQMFLVRYYYDKDVKKRNEKETKLWLNNIIHNYTNDCLRLLATKTLSELFGKNHSEDVLKAFSTFDSGSKICGRYNIFPNIACGGYSLLETCLSDDCDLPHLKKAAHIALEYAGPRCVVYDHRYLKIMTELFNKFDATNSYGAINYYWARDRAKDQALYDAIRQAFEAKLDKRFIRELLKNCSCIGNVRIYPDKTYYIKCLGDSAVAAVKPVLKESLPVRGLEGLFFMEIPWDFYFEVVELSGSVYGNDCFYAINNNGEIQQLKVGEIFKPSRNSNSYIKDVTHFYYTLEDALYAPFDT